MQPTMVSVSSWKRTPTTRPLRVYAFDPIVGKQLQNATIDTATLDIHWEEVQPGPVGEYVEVIDYDPSVDCFYEPVDLNDPYILTQAGLPPSEGTPQFHQQMVYAVAMRTIANFEKALGRRALWAPRKTARGGGGAAPPDKGYVQRLRIYPHALREPNAYYSPDKKALLFGYFPARADGAGNNLPGGLVFSCLSHDVVAHETTHALLDGLHPYFAEPSNPDVLAFHEAFADIVALFQHFSQLEPLRHQIAKTRGILTDPSLLSELAQQFGQATGRDRALRRYVVPETKRRITEEQYAAESIDGVSEPHERGARLVAAIFDAFLVLYEARTADLIRIASGGTGVMPNGQLHPDLVNRLATEASKVAQHLCTMCIRALDYCPPFGITFGEFLRALITADIDLVPDDPWRYRVALIEAFRRRGIYPKSVRTLSTESLCWCPILNSEQITRIGKWIELVEKSRTDFQSLVGFNLRANRKDIFEASQHDAAVLHNQFFSAEGKLDADIARAMGLAVKGDLPKWIRQENGVPFTRVFNVRPARRIGPDGQTEADLVMELIQTREVPYDEGSPDGPTFKFRGGCTLLINRERREVRWCVVKSIFDEQRLQEEREYRTSAQGFALSATYFGDPRQQGFQEPFAFLHRGC